MNKWRHGRGAVPIWVLLQDRSPEALTIDLQELQRALATPMSPRYQATARM